jgi:hypothetical protein
MEVKVESTITLSINGQKFELTRSDAQQIYNALGNVLGNNSLSYPPGVRNPNYNPNQWPGTVPCDNPVPVGPWVNPKWGDLYNHDKIKYGTNFEVTCEANNL